MVKKTADINLPGKLTTSSGLDKIALTHLTAARRTLLYDTSAVSELMSRHIGKAAKRGQFVTPPSPPTPAEVKERAKSLDLKTLAALGVVPDNNSERAREHNAALDGLLEVFKSATEKAKERALQLDGYATIEDGQVVVKRHK
ncbi:MAG: hypothetical protein RH946_03740 [Rhodospirillales bacterium]